MIMHPRPHRMNITQDMQWAQDNMKCAMCFSPKVVVQTDSGEFLCAEDDLINDDIASSKS